MDQQSPPDVSGGGTFGNILPGGRLPAFDSNSTKTKKRTSLLFKKKKDIYMKIHKQNDVCQF